MRGGPRSTCLSRQPPYERDSVFHHDSRTAVLADLIENFEPGKLSGLFGVFAWLGGMTDPDGKTPIDLRLTFLGGKDEARACLDRMLAWAPEKVIMAHGRPYLQDGAAELHRAFRWLKSA